MASKINVSVPIIVFLVGALAVFFNLLAYVKRIKAEDVTVKANGSCVYPRSPSFVLGIVAAGLLLVEQIVITAGTHCFYCCGKGFAAHCSVITSLVFLFCSWVTFIIAFLGLLYIAVLNNRKYLKQTYPGGSGHICNVADTILYLGVAFWSMVTIVLGLISYIFWACSTPRRNYNQQQQQDVAMMESRSQPPNQQT